MALNRWLGAALLVSVFGFAGCAKPTPVTDSTPSAVQTTPAETAMTNTPAPAETTPAPADTETPTTASTPTDTGTPTAAASGSESEIDEDFEDAEGMKGYEEVLAMTVPPTSPEVEAKGKELFETNCATCHGPQGLGDGDAGKTLDPPPRNFTKVDEYKYGHLEKALYRTGMYGIDGTGMAPWDGLIEPNDMWAIGHYIRTLQK